MRNIAIMATSGGAGKDTVADYIKQYALKESMQKYKSFALADGIYDICQDFLQVPRDKVDRHYLQDIGESMRSIFGEMIWIKRTDKKVSQTNTIENTNAIISDVRKVSEYAHYCVEGDFKPLYISVDKDIAKKRLSNRDGGFNESDLKKKLETQLNFIEELPTVKVGKHGLKKVSLSDDNNVLNNIYIIDNSGDLENTKRQIREWWGLIDE